MDGLLRDNKKEDEIAPRAFLFPNHFIVRHSLILHQEGTSQEIKNEKDRDVHLKCKKKSSEGEESPETRT